MLMQHRANSLEDSSEFSELRTPLRHVVGDVPQLQECVLRQAGRDDDYFGRT